MFKLLSLASLVFFSSSSQNGCKNDQIFTHNGCIADCRSQTFSNCSHQAFTEQFAPNFCALKNTGQWTQFTHECQACLQEDYVGVTKGQCSRLLKKKFKYHAKFSTSYLRKIECTQNRPTQATCEQRQYLIPPQLNFCGVSTDGSLNGFDRACSACKDLNIEYYFDAPCQEVLEQYQIEDQNIQSNQNNLDIIEPNHHQNNFCFDDSCCKKWQFCLQKKCIDKCALMRCAEGCERGQCLGSVIKN